MTHRKVAAVLVVLALAGCDLPIPHLTAKLGLFGRYRLMTIDGQPLPASTGSTVIDSGFFEVGSGDEIIFQDYYHALGTDGSSPSQIRTRAYKLDEAESGTIYGIPHPAMRNSTTRCSVGRAIP